LFNPFNHLLYRYVPLIHKVSSTLMLILLTCLRTVGS